MSVAPPPGTQRVLQHFQRILQADGGQLELIDSSNGVMTLRYLPGHNEQCADCVLSPEDLKELVTEAMQQHDPSVKAVELLVAPAATH